MKGSRLVDFLSNSKTALTENATELQSFFFFFILNKMLARMEFPEETHNLIIGFMSYDCPCN